MRYVVVGASASGISGAKNLREIDKEAEIILISKDEHVYSRCILHHYIKGERTIKELDFAPDEFFEKYHIKWMKGIEVIGIDPKTHQLTLSNGEIMSYDKVLLATGASAFIPPIENLREANHVVGLRNLEDAVTIKACLGHIKHAVVLGAGLVGIDAVTGMMDEKVKITLVEMGDRILPIQLDDYTAGVYEKRFKEKGVDVRLGVKAEKVILDEAHNPVALQLSTGEEVPCELIVVCTGVRANVGFLEGSGIETDKYGLIINEKGETNTKDVYGAGDVTGRNPIWPTAVKEGIIAAHNMMGDELYMTDFFSSKNTMNFLGIATLSLGVPIKPDDTYEEEIQKEGRDYKKIIHKEGKIYGAIIQGDLSYAGVLTQLVKFRIDISTIQKPLFKIDYGDFFNIKENQEYTY